MPHKLRWPEISRALARHNPTRTYELLRERLDPGRAGRALVALVRTVPNWPQPDAVQAPRGELSGREMEVLFHAAEGLTVNQTARALNVSPEAVRSRRKQILYKLDCPNVQAAIGEAFRRGLLP